MVLGLKTLAKWRSFTFETPHIPLPQLVKKRMTSSIICAQSIKRDALIRWWLLSLIPRMKLPGLLLYSLLALGMIPIIINHGEERGTSITRKN
jgi:hypothetical protein